MAIADIKAKIGSVCYNKGALPNLLGKRFTTFFDRLERIIYRSTQELGEKIRDAARLELMATTGSGRHYKYVKYDKETKKETTLFEWQASSPFNLPANVSGKIANSIEYFIMSDKGDVLSELTIGVFSGRPGGLYPTVAFVGPKKLSKKAIEEGEINDVAGRLIVSDEGKQTPLKVIASVLEEGRVIGRPMAPRPFLTILFKKYIIQFKDEIRDAMKEALSETFGKKKLPIYFRIYIRENTSKFI